MTTPSPTAPIDLTKNVNNVCNLKCSYSFSYAPTNLRITNKGDYISFKVDETTMPPVIYNDQNYNVTEVRLYHPSLHTYSGGSTTDAELIISHVNTANTQRLLVCIPIIKSGTSTAESANYFDSILTEIQRTANSYGQQTVYNQPTFSLGKFVPLKPYYSYTGTLPWSPNNGSYNYIVFQKEDAITMSTQAYNVLKAVTNSHNINTKSNPQDVFYNASGPVPPNRGEIYIDCQPTGDDGEILVPMKLDAGGLMDNEMLRKLFNFTLVKIFIGALIMIIIWKLSMKVINSIASHSARMASVAINNAQKVNI
jgi:hypothetical protein